MPLVSMPGDCDLDGDLDLGDFQGLPGCPSGPGLTPPPTSPLGCDCLSTFDLNADLDVDLADFAIFQSLPHGP